MKKLLLALAALLGLGVLTSKKSEVGPSEPSEPSKSSDPHAPPWNPPAPGRPLKQSEVTSEMSAWAVSVLNGPLEMHEIAIRSFPEGDVIARVEWHTLQAATGKKGLFRGVSLYRDPTVYSF